MIIIYVLLIAELLGMILFIYEINKAPVYPDDYDT